MKWTTKQKTTGDWSRWFALWPVQVRLHSDGSEEHVWLRFVWRKRITGFYWQKSYIYRLERP